jgi:UTP--glucose-1-phosphate uridylyltransferase
MGKTKPIRKAVIAAAGLGTRFLPQTKAMPKEMLPIVDKPVIQYVVELLVEAGVQDIVIVTGYHKRSIEDHFDDVSADLRQSLNDSGKDKLLEEISKISELANFIYVRQKGPIGNATPLLCVEHLIGNEPFIYAWGDGFMHSKPSQFVQLVDVYNQCKGSVLACIEADEDKDYKIYGYVGGNPMRESLIEIKNIIERPGSREKAPSSLATVSGYLLMPEIFGYVRKRLENLEPGKELFLQESMQDMVNDGHKFYGCVTPGAKFYDAGDKLEYLKTVVDFGLMRDGLKDDFKEYLRGLNL